MSEKSFFNNNNLLYLQSYKYRFIESITKKYLFSFPWFHFIHVSASTALAVDLLALWSQLESIANVICLNFASFSLHFLNLCFTFVSLPPPTPLLFHFSKTVMNEMNEMVHAGVFGWGVAL